jgi:hypothetical protein
MFLPRLLKVRTRALLSPTRSDFTVSSKEILDHNALYRDDMDEFEYQAWEDAHIKLMNKHDLLSMEQRKVDGGGIKSPEEKPII